MSKLEAVAVAEAIDVKPLRRDSFWTWLPGSKKEWSQDNLIAALRNGEFHFKTYEAAVRALQVWLERTSSHPTPEESDAYTILEIQPVRCLSHKQVTVHTRVSVEVTEGEK